jgi:hypothetical protein
MTNPVYELINANSGALPAGVIVETETQVSGAQRQIVAVNNAADGSILNVTTTRADDFYNDAFQRLRVSNTDQRFDADFTYDLSPLLFDRIGSGGTITHDANSRDAVIAIAAATNGLSEGLRQHYANPYTKGNSQFIALTGIINGGNVAAGRAEVFLRSSITGSVVEQVIEQASWLSNTTGRNWQYSHILLIDFQSLKVGRVRFGLDIGGVAHAIAAISNDNIRAAGYWQLAEQPTYWRQYNTATYSYTEMGYGDEANAIGLRYRVPVTASQSMRAICATVKSEGGGDLHEIAGAKFSASNGVTARTVSTTYVPVLSIQLKSTFNTFVNNGIVFPDSFSISNDNALYYEVRINPSLTGGSFASVSADSLCNVNVSSTAVSGGRVVFADYAASAQAGVKSSGKSGIIDKIPLSVSALGVGDILSICCIRNANNNSLTQCALNWTEVR